MKNGKRVRGIAAGMACITASGCLLFSAPVLAAEPVEVVTAEAAIAEEITAVEPVAIPEEIPVDEPEVITAAEPEAVEEEIIVLTGEEEIEHTDLYDAAGDSFGTAIPITSRSSAAVTFSSAGENRYYKLTTPSDGYVNITMSHPLLTTTSPCWSAEVFDENQNNVSGDVSFMGNVSSSTGSNIGLPAGTYYLKVMAFGEGVGTPVTFRYQFVAQANREKEPNGDLARRNPIALNTQYTGSVRSGLEQDCYEFTLPQKGYITMEFRHDKSGDENDGYFIDIGTVKRSDFVDGMWDYSSILSLGGYVKPYNDASNWTSAPVGLAAGTYALNILNGTYGAPEGDYTFRINYTADSGSNWETEPNNVTNGANWIPTDKTMQGSMMRGAFYTDYDFYAFELKTKTTVNVTYQHVSGTANSVIIYDRNGQSKQDTRYSQKEKSSFTTVPITLEAGLNYICISGSDSQQPYTFRINTGKNAIMSYGEWKRENNKWWYRYGDGSYPKNKWAQIEGKWYHFDKSGYMQTGWKKIGKSWYYMNKSGVMQTGWKKIGGKWYYLNKESGAMKTGWLQDGSKWYYLNKQGVMQTGWVKSGGKWYYMDGKGRMIANTSRKIGRKTYRFDSKGRCTNPNQ